VSARLLLLLLLALPAIATPVRAFPTCLKKIVGSNVPFADIFPHCFSLIY
jgi:hypothetical protein